MMIFDDIQNLEKNENKMQTSLKCMLIESFLHPFSSIFIHFHPLKIEN